MTRRNRLADLLRFYGDRPRADDARDPVESERDWIDVDAEDDGDGDPEAGLPLARTFGPGTRPLTWKEHLGALRHAMDSTREDTAPDWPPGREVLYVVDPAATIAQGALVLEVLARDPRKRGGFTQLRRLGLRRTQLAALPEAADREILALLGGTRDPDRLWLDSHPSYGAVSHRYLVPPDLHGSLMPLLCRTGRAWLRASPADADLVTLGWDDGPAFTPSLDVRADPKTGYYVVTGSLCRGAERVELSAVRLLLAGGLVFAGERVARLDDGGAFPWLAHLRRHGSMRVPLAQGGAFLDALLRLPRLPRLELPDELKYEEITAPPRPRLRVRAAPSHWGSQRLRAALSFDYDGAVVRMDRDSAGVFQAERRRFLRRDASAERQAAARLRQAGFGERTVYESDRPRKAFDLPARDLARAVGQLVKEGWHVEADGKLYRQPGAFKIEVSSGVDWFELHGTVDFGSAVAQLPELLAALRRRESTVLLGDGTYGVLPEEWLRRYGMLATLGTPTDDHVRFGRNQVGLLDALLSAPARGERRRRLRPRPRGAGIVRGHRAARPARGLRRAAARLSARRARMAALRGALRLRRLPRRRHGPRQDGAGAGAARIAPRGARGRRRSTRAARGPGPRSPWCRGRSCSTGGRRRRGSRPSCGCSITRAPGASARGSTSRTTTSC